MVNFFLINSLISIEQHGFVSTKACVTNLLECLYLKINAIHKQRKLDVLYTDFIKAFVNVFHRKIIHKLRAFRFGCKLIDWISAFIISRKQLVVKGQSSSSWCDVDSGVPQESVLRLLLFIFYINNLPDNLTNKFKLYADDGKLKVEFGTDRDDDDI